MSTGAAPVPATIHAPPSARQRAASSAPVVRAVAKEHRAAARLDAGGTRLRLRALHVMGHSSARIARSTPGRAREMTIRRLTRGDASTVSPQLRDAVTALYDTWWDKRAPERTRAERAAATLGRRRAAAGNWCAAAALDEDRLDVPGYRPRSPWPAAGTGVAPDIHPPSRKGA
jgi:hypothetical protein